GTPPRYPPVIITSISTSGPGGYGSRLANNANCGAEASPGGSSSPGSGSCAGDIRYIGEGTVGFWHKLYQGDKGRVQWGIQYSYLYKTGWSGSGGVTAPGAPGIAPHAVDNMVLTSFRFYIP